LLVREITAYIGMILVLHVQGKWDDGANDLWSTGVVIPGPWQVHKARNFVTDASSIFIIGGEAAYTWDRILDGQKPKLRRVYKEAVTKTLREF
jgi:hypothetical protein